MYSAPDFVKISVQQTNAFASVIGDCDPEWYMSKSSLDETCKQITMVEGLEYQCYVYQNPPT